MWVKKLLNPKLYLCLFYSIVVQWDGNKMQDSLKKKGKKKFYFIFLKVISDIWWLKQKALYVVASI